MATTGSNSVGFAASIVGFDVNLLRLSANISFAVRVDTVLDNDSVVPGQDIGDSIHAEVNLSSETFQEILNSDQFLQLAYDKAIEKASASAINLANQIAATVPQPEV